MGLKYRDYYGTYRIIKHRNGTFSLIFRDRYGFLTFKNTYKTELGAKRALSSFCGGMPERYKGRTKNDA